MYVGTLSIALNKIIFMMITQLLRYTFTKWVFLRCELMAQLIFLSMLVHSLCLCIFKSSKFQMSVYVWLHSRGQYVWEDHRPRNGIWKGTNGGEAFCFSGCDDDQTSADTSVRHLKIFKKSSNFCSNTSYNFWLKNYNG